MSLMSLFQFILTKKEIEDTNNIFNNAIEVEAAQEEENPLLEVKDEDHSLSSRMLQSISSLVERGLCPCLHFERDERQMTSPSPVTESKEEKNFPKWLTDLCLDPTSDSEDSYESVASLLLGSQYVSFRSQLPRDRTFNSHLSLDKTDGKVSQI